MDKQQWRSEFLAKVRHYGRMGPRAALTLAGRSYQKRCAKSRQAGLYRPRVKVLAVGERRLFVRTVGDHFVSAYRWSNLQRKVALEQWKRLDSTPALHKRLNNI